MRLQFQSKTWLHWIGVGERVPTSWQESPGHTPSFCNILPMRDRVFCWWSPSKPSTDQSWTLRMKSEWQSQNGNRFDNICSMKRCED
ncbi:Uncharacterized protein FKW44_014475 [Caligus rogercresseyi]|uniref:Uncharacterized protein n=1 Tax=Caligus rogercresseyi TaxID=217165 RepID=A0A7T8GZK9_CALRO|nr:Uncharacterized protein FKW44_014475 [Caligus rogercresseyi]